MGIHEEDIATVRATSDIVAIVSQYTQLRKVGRQWVGLCPFHTENTGSFSVSSADNVYYCFGCGVRGDVIDFVMNREQVDFARAVESLAAKANVTLRYTDRDQGEGRRRRTRLIETMAKAVDWYHERLLTGGDAGAARSYLRARGLGGDVVRDFRIGWAPDGWDALCQALRLDEDMATGTGLGRSGSRGLQDHFRARILFPISDDRGDPISFGGRILPGTETRWNQGKYKNTTETPLYNKSKVLYGLDRAKAAIVTSGTAVICEGYTDVIGFHRAGVPLAVATCGTALTDEHVTLLTRFAAKRLVLAFDADGAGLAAAERFYQWEREHDLDVRVADLPPGQDPADVAASDPDRLAAAVEKATPFLEFRLDRAFAAADLTGHEGRARAAERALEIVAEHPSDLVRDQYVMDVASRCRIEPDRLRSRLAELTARPARGGGGPARGGGGDRSRRAVENRPDDAPPPGVRAPASRHGMAAHAAEGPGIEVLRHAVHDPEAVGEWLDAALFDDPVQQMVYDALVAHDTHLEALDAVPEEAADLLARLLVDEPASEPFDAVRRLLTETARREIAAVRLAAATEADGTQALRDLAILTRVIDGLRQPQTSADSAKRLLAWLADRVGNGG
jgi:DNA primase